MKKHIFHRGLLFLTVIALLFSAFSCLCVLGTDNAFAATDYYSSITATSGTALLGQLHDLITTTHKKYTSYEDCSSPSYVVQTDRGSTSNYVMEFYSQIDMSKSWGSGSVGTWNREHVWCKSLSNNLWKTVKNSTKNAGSDMHHIRPAESGLNSTRGNNKFGVVQNGEAAYTKGGTVALGGYVGGGTFEPLDNVKGDVARIVMYVYTHYNTYSNVGGTTNGSGSADCFGTLKFTNVVSASSESAAIAMLLEWNELDPVDDIERNRNEAVYEIQGNRNPFIDDPDYANKIWDENYNNSQPLESISFQQTSLSVAVGSTATLTVVTTPSNAKKNLTWTSSNASVATVSNGVVTGVSAGTATITATDKDTGKSATATVTVKTLTGISVSGTPAKTEYTAGNVFSPTGLTVTATYSDGSTSVMDNSNCQWLDGVTKSTKLSQGTTTVICKYGSFEQTISGITVNESKDGDVKYVTIDTSSFEMTEGYGFKNWSTDAASGFAFIYGGGQYSATGLQFNVSKDSYYLASNVALPGRIVSVTVKIVSGKAERPWKLLTSDTAYTQVAGKPTNGTDWGTQMVTAEGVTWTVDSGDDTFFALTYELAEKSGASYLDSIVIGYVEGNGGTVTPTPDSVSLNKTALSLEVGASETLVATVGGSSTASWSSSNTNVATVDQNGKVTAVGAGTTTITVASGTAKATCTVTVTAGSTTTSSKDDYFDAVVANPTVGSNYKLALWQESLSKVFYAVAEMTSDGYIQTTENVADAAIVSLEAGTYEGCYYLKLGNKYVSLNSTWSGKYVKASITLTDSPTTEFYVGTHNELAAVVTANDGDGVLQTGTVYLGTHGSYSTIAASSTYYLEDETAIDVSQYVARLVVADGGSTTPDPTPDDAATEFKGLVSAVQSATGMEAKFNAIKAALVKYGTLTDEQKTAVASDYQTLQNEIASYNQGATSANEEHNAALKNALASGSLISAGFVALLSLIKRKFQ